MYHGANMPSIESANRHQKSVLWELNGTDKYGKPTVSDPVEINVRWEWIHKEKVDSKGNTIAIDACVVTNFQTTVGSIMWLGPLSSWEGTGSAGDNTKLMQVVVSSVIPDLKNRNTRYVSDLMFYADTLPEVV